MAGTIAPPPWFTGLDDNGVSVIGGKLYTYAAGTSTPLATYRDVDLQVPNANPTILDGGGRATIFLAAASYKFVLKDKNDVTIRTQDNIAAMAPFNADLDISGIAGEALTAGSVAYLSVGAELPTPLTAGRWYLAHADFDFSSAEADFIAIVQGNVLADNVGAFRLQGRSTVPGPLTIGATYYIAVTPGQLVTPQPSPGPPTNFVRVVGIADSQTTLVSATGFGSNAVISGNTNITGDLSVGGGVLVGGSIGTTGDFVFSATAPRWLRFNTPDASDTGILLITAGGPASADGSRGAFVHLHGNEAPPPYGLPGCLSVGAGDAAQGDIRFYTGNVTERGRMHRSGAFSWGFVSDPGGGNMCVAGNLYVGRPHNGALPLSGNLSVLALASSGMDGIQVQVDTDAVPGARFVNFFNAAGAPQGSISAGTPSITTYNTTSDIRLKTDLGVSLETRVLPALVVHDFQWKADGVVSRGVFAQEAVAVLPVAVTVGCEGPVVDQPWMVDYSKYVPDLIVGWQEHERRIISLLERLEALESRHDGKTP